MDQDHTFEPLQAEPRRRRTSTGDPEPDALLRRLPSGHTSAQDSTSQSDPDTCRICRGEATQDEPLFYPCKCSGSIKYVHQDCLMEWLSHSQKKHCELCKTPFRFTKLYAPNMPKTVPFYVFISHIAKYLFRNMLVWARGGLVLMVWLVWLPYLMRRVWSALFWLSDEGLGPVFGRSEAGSVLRESAAGSTAGAATCPSSPLHAATTTAASLQGLMSQIPRSSTAMTTTSLYGINITSDNPLSNILLNMFLGTFYIGGTASRTNASANVQNIAPATVVHQPTLLSEVGFLQKISSSSPALGSFAIDILEGQIITVLVIICFILIILVRDYVVQQQPDINMRAAFAAADNVAPQENVAPAAAIPDPTEGLRPEDIDRLRGPEAPDIVFGDGPMNGDEGDGNALWTDLEELHGSAAADVQTLARVAPATPDSPSEELSQQNMRAQTTLATVANTSDGHASEIGRSTVDEYVRIHRAAAGDPETIINIIRQENLEDRLAYFVQLTQSQMNRKRPDDEESSSQMAEWGSEPDWPWAEDSQEEGHSGKGKTPLTNGSSDARGEQSHTSRPRSATDGPQRVGGINPLANNNWSWPDASLESPRADPRQSPTLGMQASSQRTPTDETGSASQPWAFATPPSSTLAESAPSSSQGQTPGSSEIDDVPVNELNPEHRNILDPAVDTGRPLDWEAIPDFNAPLEVQPNEGAQDAGELAQEQPQVDGLARRLADFMWRDVEAIPVHELPPLPDAADEFFDHDQDAAAVIAQDRLPELQDQEQDQEVAAAAGIDAEAEAIEDAEDLEGILELLGMRGPIAGLFQNALFCAFLVSITLFLGVFLPYNLGRLAIWLVANPARPVRILFSLSKLVQDTALLLMGFASTLLFGAVDTLLTVIRPSATRPGMISQSMQGSWNMTENAFQRLLDSMWTDLPFISADEVRNFSTVSHVALFTLKGQVALLFTTLGKSVLFLFGGDYPSKAAELCSLISTATTTTWQGLSEVPNLLLNPTSWVIDLGTATESVAPLKAELASWSAMDRVCAILGGYVALSFSAALYLGRGGPISPGRVGQEWEATLIDALNQASGVMKVILIIGIEMLVFPLYCGLLLDIGLLPLFENTTIMSRVMFTVNYPLTSIFVHWFVGTGYMFHFALFVSMCRKIMRKGVLCKLMPPQNFSPTNLYLRYEPQTSSAIPMTPSFILFEMFWSETSPRNCGKSYSLLLYTAL